MTRELQQQTFEAMQRHRQLAQPHGIAPTVDYTMMRAVRMIDCKNDIKRQLHRAEQMLGDQFLAHMVMRPFLTAYSTLLLLNSIRTILSKSHLAGSRRSCDAVKAAQRALDKWMQEHRERSDDEQVRFVQMYSDSWFQRFGAAEITTWHNCYSRQLLRSRIASSNDNLRDLVAYVLVARDLSEEIHTECQRLKAEADRIIDGRLTIDIVYYNDDLRKAVAKACDTLMHDLHVPDVKNPQLNTCLTNWRHYIDQISKDKVIVDENKNLVI